MNHILATQLKLGEVFIWKARPQICLHDVITVVSTPSIFCSGKIRFCAFFSVYSKVYWMTCYEHDEFLVFE